MVGRLAGTRKLGGSNSMIAIASRAFSPQGSSRPEGEVLAIDETFSRRGLSGTGTNSVQLKSAAIPTPPRIFPLSKNPQHSAKMQQ